MELVFLIAVVCYVCMQAIETASLASRVAGRLTGTPALATTLQQTIFVCSRIFLPPLLLALSYQTETKNDLEGFLLLSIVMIGTAFAASAIIFFHFDRCQMIFQILLFHCRTERLPTCFAKLVIDNNSHVPIVVDDVTFRYTYLNFSKLLAGSFAYFFISTSFLLAFSVAHLVPDYRLTISQFSTAFHGIGAGFFALYLDPMISKSLDISSSDEEWLSNVYSVLVGRIFSFIIALIVFTSVLLATGGRAIGQIGS